MGKEKGSGNYPQIINLRVSNNLYKQLEKLAHKKKIKLSEVLPILGTGGWAN